MSSLTDVPGVLVGHAQDLAGLTGVTVVLTPQGAVCGVDIRGGAPATRETALLDPTATVDQVHAICVTGGSAFGLESAAGVVRYLRERSVGFDARIARVPIVPTAALFDLGLGSAEAYPSAAMGYAACQAARERDVPEGCVGAGTGASVGKLFGFAGATKGGLGMASETSPSGIILAALVACNAFGDVYLDGSERILAGARRSDGRGFANTSRSLRSAELSLGFAGAEPTHTTLVVVATNATLTKAECTKLAQMAQDGLARTIRPVHTPGDGDLVFALATSTAPHLHLGVLGSVAADVVARAVVRSVLAATPLGGLPSASQLMEGEESIA